MEVGLTWAQEIEQRKKQSGIKSILCHVGSENPEHYLLSDIEKLYLEYPRENQMINGRFL
jgi:hypothetical protein